jgi:hypothetical protein
VLGVSADRPFLRGTKGSTDWGKRRHGSRGLLPGSTRVQKIAEGLLTTLEKWVTHQIGGVIGHEAMPPALVMVAGMSQLRSRSGA